MATIQSGNGKQARVSHGGPKTSPPTKWKERKVQRVGFGKLTTSQPNK